MKISIHGIFCAIALLCVVLVVSGCGSTTFDPQNPYAEVTGSEKGRILSDVRTGDFDEMIDFPDGDKSVKIFFDGEANRVRLEGRLIYLTAENHEGREIFIIRDEDTGKWEY